MLNQLQYCEERGIPLALIIGESELQAGIVKVRLVEKREEFEYKRSELVSAIKEKLTELQNEASFWDDQDGAQRVLREIKGLRRIVDPVRRSDTALEEVDLLVEMGADDPEEVFEELERTVKAIESDVDQLEGLGNAVYKIGSDDATNPPLVRYVARLGKPILLSTGMCTMDDSIQDLLNKGLITRETAAFYAEDTNRFQN